MHGNQNTHTHIYIFIHIHTQRYLHTYIGNWSKKMVLKNISGTKWPDYSANVHLRYNLALESIACEITGNNTHYKYLDFIHMFQFCHNLALSAPALFRHAWIGNSVYNVTYNVTCASAQGTVKLFQGKPSNGGSGDSVFRKVWR